jgi:DNA gyrase inhibitor GyrI
LVAKGKGKIWDIAYTNDDLPLLCYKLINYKKDNEQEIKEIAAWYKENFFIEPTKDNIVEIFVENPKDTENTFSKDDVKKMYNKTTKF